MLLIITDENDYSTHEVIDWLLGYDIPFIRLNESDAVKVHSIEIENDKVDFRMDINPTLGPLFSICLSEISSFWYRRGFINLDIHFENSFSAKLNHAVNVFLNREIVAVSDFIHLMLETKKSVGSISQNTTNKLYNLYLAQIAGLQIPETCIASEKKALTSFFTRSNGRSIAKAISQGLIKLGSWDMGYYTTEVTPNDVEESPSQFFPSKFQSMLNKCYELRIFCWNGQFYTSAIFSQADEKTKVDFRHYNREKPNRVVPYVLPKDISEKLDRFMSYGEFDSGSIDMVVTDQGQYVFLEINPVGQFNQVSKPCNYYLEREIAKDFNHG